MTKIAALIASLTTTDMRASLAVLQSMPADARAGTIDLAQLVRHVLTLSPVRRRTLSALADTTPRAYAQATRQHDTSDDDAAGDADAYARSIGARVGPPSLPRYRRRTSLTSLPADLAAAAVGLAVPDLADEDAPQAESRSSPAPDSGSPLGDAPKATGKPSQRPPYMSFPTAQFFGGSRSRAVRIDHEFDARAGGYGKW
jgi:hypothetical protein